jgi:predicted DNA-binding protein
MSATRTQVYLTPEQRRRIDAITARDGVTMADVVRTALDHYLQGSGSDPAAALQATFGVDPDMAVPSRDEWHRG